MHATLSDAIQLTIGGIVGLGLAYTMEKHGISIFIKGTREKAISYLIMFCCAWLIGMTLIMRFTGQIP